MIIEEFQLQLLIKLHYHLMEKLMQKQFKMFVLFLYFNYIFYHYLISMNENVINQIKF